MKFNYLTYKNTKIPIYVQDNKKDTTFLFLHGINSSSDFINNIKNKEHNYNIVALNFPGSIYWEEIKPEDIFLEDWINVAKIVLKNIKSKKIVIVAHSMAGGVAVELANDKRVKKMVMLSTINYSMLNSKSYNVLKSVIGTTEKNSPSFFGKLIMFGAQFTKKGKKLLESFSKKGKWYNLLQKYVLNEEFMIELDKKYKEAAQKMIFVIGNKDAIIGTDEFINYGEQLNIPSFIIGETHSPIKARPEAMNIFLNNIIKSKKRWFFSKFITFKNKIYQVKPLSANEEPTEEDLDNLVSEKGE